MSGRKQPSNSLYLENSFCFQSSQQQTLGFDLFAYSMVLPSKIQASGWKTVHNKGRRVFTGDKWDIMKNVNEGALGKITSFFFTDFDSSWRVEDLFFEFKELGIVDEIVIPPKKDWREKNMAL